MNSLKITQIGNSFGVVLPKEILARLNVTKDDEIFLSRTPHGVLLTTTDPEFEQQMTLAREIMRDYRDALAELAK